MLRKNMGNFFFNLLKFATFEPLFLTLSDEIKLGA